MLDEYLKADWKLLLPVYILTGNPFLKTEDVGKQLIGENCG